MLALFYVHAAGFCSPSLRIRAPAQRVVMTEQPATSGSVIGRIDVQTTERLTLSLRDCRAKGIGIGLDPQNVIDMLVPGKSASVSLQMGDEIISWNEIPLLDPATGEQIKIAAVVDGTLDEHAVVVNRRLKPISDAESAALTEEMYRRCSGTDEKAAQAPSESMQTAPPKDEAAKEWAPQTDWSADESWKSAE